MVVRWVQGVPRGGACEQLGARLAPSANVVEVAAALIAGWMFRRSRLIQCTTREYTGFKPASNLCAVAPKSGTTCSLVLHTRTSTCALVFSPPPISAHWRDARAPRASQACTLEQARAPQCSARNKARSRLTHACTRWCLAPGTPTARAASLACGWLCMTRIHAACEPASGLCAVAVKRKRCLGQVKRAARPRRCAQA